MRQDLTSTEETPGASDRADGVGTAAAAARANARAAVEAAERAFPGWSATPAAERRRPLERASELLMERQADIAALVTEETRGTLGWGMFNVQLAAGMLAYYAGQADALAEEQEIPSHIPGKRAKAVRQPVGVVVGIAPWNAPVVLGVRAVAAPLAYGNTVVLKASEQCPRTHAAIVDALKDAGVPAGRSTQYSTAYWAASCHANGWPRLRRGAVPARRYMKMVDGRFSTRFRHS